MESRPKSDIEDFRCSLSRCQYEYQAARSGRVTFYTSDAGERIAMIVHYSDEDIYIGLS